MTDLNPSQEILWLCKELNIEPPALGLNGFSIASLLQWDGWGLENIGVTEDDAEVCISVDKMTCSAFIRKVSQGLIREWDEVLCVEYHIKECGPREALQHLAIARLRQIKQEKEQ